MSQKLGEIKSKFKDDLVSSFQPRQTKLSSRMILAFSWWILWKWPRRYRQQKTNRVLLLRHHDFNFFWPKCDLSAMYVNDEEKSKLIWQPSDPVVLLWESLKSIREQSFNLFLSRSSQMSGVSSISPELQFSEMDISTI